MPTVKELIESEKSHESITSEIYQDGNEFEKLSATLSERIVGDDINVEKAFCKHVNKPLTDPAHFDEEVTSVTYGKRTDERFFVVLKTQLGAQYMVGSPRSLKEAYQQAKVLTEQRDINLSELHSKKVK